MHTDVVIVGAGILGLAHAYWAARLGKSVTVIERERFSAGASLRSFGSIWPIGQALGEPQRCALRSKERWLELLVEAGAWYSDGGALFLAYSDDELQVLHEFSCSVRESGLDIHLETAEAIVNSCTLVNPEGLRGGLRSTTEICVDPREVMRKLTALLASAYGVHFEFGVSVVEISAPCVRTNSGTWRARQIVVCAGDAIESLYPGLYRSSGITRCKLQMLRLTEKSLVRRLQPIVCSGLTYCHYPAFEKCATLPILLSRLRRELPDLVRAGIHVMIAQNQLGEFVVGDSHEYDQVVNVFNDERIDNLMLRYLSSFIQLPNFSIASRWYGVYSKHETKTLYRASPESGVEVVVATTGNGLTMAFDIAERTFAV